MCKGEIKMKIQFKNEIQKIKELETEKTIIENDITNKLTDADNVCEKCEEMFGFEDEKTIKAYEEYEHIRMPLTEIETMILSAKKDLVNKIMEMGENNGIKYDKMTLNNIVLLENIVDTIISA